MASSASTWAELAVDQGALEKAASRLGFVRASPDFEDIVAGAVLICLEREERGNEMKVRPSVAAKGAVVDSARRLLGSGNSKKAQVFDQDMDRAPGWDEEDDETIRQVKEWRSLTWGERMRRADEARRATGTSISPHTAYFAARVYCRKWS